MKHIAPIVAASLLLLLPILPARASGPKDIVDTAVEAGTFQTLAAALKAADLVGALKGEGPFTVFAPTDEAFADLPEGTIPQLLKPESRERLQAILAYHVVPGRIMAGDLLKTTSAKTLGGASVGIGLRVGGANVVKADIVASNGVIHVIDKVLLPPEPARKAVRAPKDVSGVIVEAIERGVPLYNDGHPEACAAIYETAALAILAWPESQLASAHRAALEDALSKSAPDASDRAWNLRRAFDSILASPNGDGAAPRTTFRRTASKPNVEPSAADAAFRPIIEASLPKGFPAPGPVGKVVVKRYPRYRAARADGGGSFWTLFNHIKKNNVEMTAPVEMTMNADMRQTDMAFLYENPDQGEAGRDGKVDVLDLEPIKVLSIGMRGGRDADALQRAKSALSAEMLAGGWSPAGSYRVLGYNSPMVPRTKRFWELQIPVSR